MAALTLKLKGVKPVSEQAENEIKPECKHEWEEVGKDAEASADYQVVFHDTYLKCKLCGAEAVRAQTEYQYH